MPDTPRVLPSGLIEGSPEANAAEARESARLDRALGITPGAPTPAAVRGILTDAGIKPGAVEVRHELNGPAVVVRLRNPRANHLAQMVGRALDASPYRLELPAVAGLWLVHPAEQQPAELAAVLPRT